MNYSDVIATDKQHCVVEGKQCTKCCEVIVLPNTLNIRGAYKNNHTRGGDLWWIKKYFTQISKRRAKKINPYLFKDSVFADRYKDKLYFTCKKLTGDGCSAHEARPQVCRGYPYYDHIGELFSEKGEYSPTCTYWD